MKKQKYKGVKKTVEHYIDSDYLNKLEPEVFLWFTKFVEEFYGDYYTKDVPSLHGAIQRRKNSSRIAAIKNDLFNISLRVDVTPKKLDNVKPSKIRDAKHKAERITFEAEIERIDEENGIKITRYKTVKR